jgi:hypothetical protein
MSELIKREAKRYTHPNMIYSLIGLASAVGFCFGIPYLGKLYWADLLKFMKDRDITEPEFFWYFGMCHHSFMMIFGNLYYFTIYTINLPFFE